MAAPDGKIEQCGKTAPIVRPGNETFRIEVAFHFGQTEFMDGNLFLAAGKLGEDVAQPLTVRRGAPGLHFGHDQFLDDGRQGGGRCHRRFPAVKKCHHVHRAPQGFTVKGDEFFLLVRRQRRQQLLGAGRLAAKLGRPSLGRCAG